MSFLYSLLKESAQQAGFHLFGALDLKFLFEDSKDLWSQHFARFDEWLQKGFSGEMEYLKRGRERRQDVRRVFPEAKSIFCVAESYLKESPVAPCRENGPRYARYLKGEDYHLLLSRRLENMMQAVQKSWKRSQQTPLRWKVCVDTSAVLERSFAALAGLGWIGKNTALTHPKQGSYLFLAEVLINQETGEGPRLLPDFCGHCRLCLDSCPTGALHEGGWLDARECVSYLTLEKRGEFGVSKLRQKQMGTWVAGCDLCIDVCPFNQKPLKQISHQALHSHDATALTTWEELLSETEEAYQKRVSRSALKRVKWREFRRNLENAFLNSDAF